MTDYEKAMMHVELALRRACATIRREGETGAEDALWTAAGHLAELVEEARRDSLKTAQGQPGYDWKLSESAKEYLAEIDKHTLKKP